MILKEALVGLCSEHMSSVPSKKAVTHLNSRIWRLRNLHFFLEIPRTSAANLFPVTVRNTVHTRIRNYACINLLLASRDLFQVRVPKPHPTKRPPLSKLITRLIKARWIATPKKKSAYFCRPKSCLS